MIRCFLFNVMITISLSLAGLSQEKTIRVMTIDGTINPASADFIHEEIQRARQSQAECLVIQLNTPGGLLKSTRVIVSDLLNAPLPVIVYVYPSGAQSASAGVFITLAAHLAVMAPGTNIGAAHPVTMGEQQDSIMIGKMTNDAAAFIRTISEKRSRNIAWAEDAVRKSLSITETEALHNHVIDTIASDVRDLLDKIDGKQIQIGNEKIFLKTKGGSIDFIEESTRQKILDLLSDPNIAYIFMMLGFYGLLFELYNPGLIFPGIVGVISLILAFYSLHTLPVNYAGLALIIFSIVLFVLDLKLPSHGLLTTGGIISLLMGSLMLFRNESGLDILSVSWKVILSVVLLTAGFFIFAVGMGVRAQRRPPTTGIEGLIGEVGKVIEDLQPDGQIRIHGEIWSATSLDGKLEKGSSVKAVGIDNLKLKVRKLPD